VSVAAARAFVTDILAARGPKSPLALSRRPYNALSFSALSLL